MPEDSIETTETSPTEFPDLGLIAVNPSLSNEALARGLFDATLSAQPKAVILETYATGAVPTKLTPLIREITEKGIPVFLVSSNFGDEKGITKLAYEANMGAVGAGAVPLRDVNSRHMTEIMGAIQGEINAGKIGADLTRAIVDQFGTPPLPGTQTS